MALAKDLSLIVGLILVLSGVVLASNAAGLPGLGDFNNPFDDHHSTDPDADTDTYDLRSQVRLEASSLGEVRLRGFSYQTPASGPGFLSIGDTGALSLTGASDVRVTRTLVNTETGRVYASDTMVIDQLAGGSNKVIVTDVDNLEPGKYRLDFQVVFDPEWVDVTDWDNKFEKSYPIQVPKVKN